MRNYLQIVSLSSENPNEIIFENSSQNHFCPSQSPSQSDTSRRLGKEGSIAQYLSNVTAVCHVPSALCVHECVICVSERRAVSREATGGVFQIRPDDDDDDDDSSPVSGSVPPG